MAGTLNQNTWNLSKELWPQNKIVDEVLDASPAFGTITKDTSFGELARHIAVGNGLPQGVGTKFEIAKGNKSPSTAEAFRMVEKTLYVVISLDGVLLRKARVKGHEGMIVDPYARESKLAIQQYKNEQSTYFFGNGGGSLGKIDGLSTMTGNTIKLANPSDIRHFQKRMWINLAASDGTESPLQSARTGRVKILRIYQHGPLKGTIVTEEANIALAIGGATNADFIFRDGIYGDVIPGYNAWLPRADPGQADPVTGITVPSTFLGVDRSTDPSGLAGIRYDARRETIFDGIMGAASAIVDSRGNPDLCIISTLDWNKMRIETSGAGTLTRTLMPAAAIDKYRPGLSYQAFIIEGPGGPIKVLADPWCTTGRGLVLSQETWTYLCVDELVQLMGDPLRTEELADAAESRFVGDGTPYCDAPLYNATIQFADGA
jgi:hypothetical protein